MDSLAIEVRGLRKSFRIPTQRVDTLKERATGIFKRREHRSLNALRGIDFEVRKGEFFGIVGRNGSGKSTLLKLLASIYRPDAGRIRVAGRVAPCIELGVGFNPELTAHDNVVLNGVMMGLTPTEARDRYDDVIEFAELGEYTDLKLKNYSSGMLVRLGFSLMTQVDADVLLIDEVLAVGDAAFQQKCFDSFSKLHTAGKTIILVTHDIASVDSHCDRAILLENGVIDRAGEPAGVGRRYLELNFPEHRPAVESEDLEQADGTGEARIVDVTLSTEAGAPSTSFAQGAPISMDVTIEAHTELVEPMIGFQIVNADGMLIFAPQPMALNGGKPLQPGDLVRLHATIGNTLASGHYYVNAGVALGTHHPRPVVAFRKNAADFVVFGTGLFGGVVSLDYEADATVTPNGGGG